MVGSSSDPDPTDGYAKVFDAEQSFLCSKHIPSAIAVANFHVQICAAAVALDPPNTSCSCLPLHWNGWRNSSNVSSLATKPVGFFTSPPLRPRRPVMHWWITTDTTVSNDETSGHGGSSYNVLGNGCSTMKYRPCWACHSATCPHSLP